MIHLFARAAIGLEFGFKELETTSVFRNEAFNRGLEGTLALHGASIRSNDSLAFTGGSQISGSIQGAVGQGQVDELTTSATVFNFEAVKELYSRRRTIFIARAA